MKAMMIRLRRFLGSVRGRFLWLFLLGMLVTLVTASVLSYSAMHSAIGRFNNKSSRADLSQIVSNILKLSNEMERQMSMLMFDSSTHVMMNADVFTPLEVIEKAREYTDKVNLLITNFPYVSSVYLWEADGSFWATTKKNMRYFDVSESTEISENVHNLIKSATWTQTMTSGISSNDFPIPYEQDERVPLISITKKYGSCVLVFNICEQEMDSAYVGFSGNSESKIRILDEDGYIFSSADKSEIFKLYSYFTENTLAQSGEKTDVQTAKQIFWQPVPNLGLVVFNEVQLDSYWRELSEILQVVFLTFLIGLGITCLLFFLWISRVFQPLDKLIFNMGQARLGRYEPLPQRKGYDELSALIWHYNEMLYGMQKLTEDNRRAEEEKRDSELKALKSQINPHFLYNTLNTIKWMSLMEGNKKTADCITSLGKIIVPLFKSDSPTCTLQEELEVVEKYLEIMNIRCGGGIKLIKKVDSDIESFPVLRFFLQPIIENAVVHGLAPQGYCGCVEIKAECWEKCLVLRISDNGTGMSDEAIAKQNRSLLRGENVKGVGMMNTNRRIQLWYGIDYGVIISRSALGGLCVTVRFPQPPLTEKVDK